MKSRKTIDTNSTPHQQLRNDQSTSEVDYLAQRLIVFRGTSDTLSNRPGTQYRTRTLGEILDELGTFARVPKTSAPAAIFSSYNGHDARLKNAQLARGVFSALPLDIDKGNHPIETVRAMLEAFQAKDFGLFSTASATAEVRKWRGLVALAYGVDAATYLRLMQALYLHAKAWGIELDQALVRNLVQVVFLPNVPPNGGHEPYYVWGRSATRGGLDPSSVNVANIQVDTEIRHYERENNPDHPIWRAFEAGVLELTGRGEKGDGKIDIVCPWLENHGSDDDSGTSIFINANGKLGYKCHHDGCKGENEHNPNDLCNWIDDHLFGWKADHDVWKAFKGTPPPPGDQAPQAQAQAPQAPQPLYSWALPQGQAPQPQSEPQRQPWEQAIDALPMDPGSDMPRLRDLMGRIAQLPSLEQSSAMESLRRRCKGFLDRRGLDKELRDAVNRLNRERVANQGIGNVQRSAGFAKLCASWVYVAEIDRFVNHKKILILHEKSFRNMFCHLEDEIQEFSEFTGQPIRSDIVRTFLRDETLKVDRIDYWPGKPLFFSEDGYFYLNLWNNVINRGRTGAVDLWLNHFDKLGFTKADKNHILDFMACTLQHPGKKINHVLMLAGEEGIGKDFILYPMVRALSEHSNTVAGSDLGSEFNEYLLRTKHLHINELEANDKREKTRVEATLKPIAADPPDRIPVNQKGVSKIPVRNVVNVTAATNDPVPLNLGKGARRYYMAWSDTTIRGPDGQVTEAWLEYWRDRWQWMRDQNGWECCVHYLMTRDLSGFDPKAPPRVTEYQKEVVKASMPGVALLLQDQIENRCGLFANDITTAEKIHEYLRNASQAVRERTFSEYGMQNVPDKRYIGRVLSEHLGIKNEKKSYKEWEGKKEKVKTVRFYPVRNREEYMKKEGKELVELLKKIVPPAFHT